MGKHFLWDPVEDNIVKEIDDSGTTIADYTTEPYLYGDLISQHRDGQSSFYHYDGQGSTTSLTNSTANVTDTYAYSGFGEVTERIGGTVNPFQYIGQKGYYLDSETIDFQVRRRELEAALGRWTSVDPVHFVSDVNPYCVVRNRPNILIDMSGEVPWKDSRVSPTDPVEGNRTKESGPTVPPGKLLSDEFGPDPFCCRGNQVDPSKECCVLKTFKGADKLAFKKQVIVYAIGQKITCKACWRVAQLTGGYIGPYIGKYHMWLKCDFGEVGLGALAGGVPGVGGDGGYESPQLCPPTSINDHTGQADAKGSKCISFQVDACCMARQMVLRPTNRKCGPTYNCNTFVYDALKACNQNTAAADLAKAVNPPWAADVGTTPGTSLILPH